MRRRVERATGRCELVVLGGDDVGGLDELVLRAVQLGGARGDGVTQLGVAMFERVRGVEHVSLTCADQGVRINEKKEDKKPSQ